MIQVKKTVAAQVANALVNYKTVFLDSADGKLKIKDEDGVVEEVTTTSDLQTAVESVVALIPPTVPGELVFEAYVTQSNGDDPYTINSGNLVVGTTYFIDDYRDGDDFTNVGASINQSGTFFIATGTTPTVWSQESSLVYNNGAPTCTYIINNTIGCMGFQYLDIGNFRLLFPSNLVTEKTFVEISNVRGGGSGDYTSHYEYLDSSDIRIHTVKNEVNNNSILHSRIKVILLP